MGGAVWRRSGRGARTGQARAPVLPSAEIFARSVKLFVIQSELYILRAWLEKQLLIRLKGMVGMTFSVSFSLRFP